MRPAMKPAMSPPPPAATATTPAEFLPARGTIPPMDVYATFLQTTRRHRLIEPGDRILAAVSGGPDSTALLALLTQLREPPFELAVAHLDHGIRGAAGAEDATFVAELARRHGLECFSERLEPPGQHDSGQPAPGGASPGQPAPGPASPGAFPSEASLRQQRLAFLARTAARWGAGKIALGHTRDDQAETFLLNLLRGAGSHGLGGMAVIGPLPGGVTAVRPLLFVSRQAIETWLAGQSLTARQDATNLDPAYLRNRVRAELLPLFEDLRPGARAAIARAAHLLQDDETHLEALAEQALAHLGLTGPSHPSPAPLPAPGSAPASDPIPGPARAPGSTPGSAPDPDPAAAPAGNRSLALSVESLRALPRPLARRVLRRAFSEAASMAGTETAAPEQPGASWSPGLRQIDAVLELVQDGRGGQVDLGAGRVARVKGGLRGQVTFHDARRA